MTLVVAFLKIQKLKWCSYIYPQMWGKSHWNQFWDGAPSSGHSHLPNARKIANLAISQEPVKQETWFWTTI